MKNGTKKMKAGGKTTGKTKKFAVGGFAPFMPGPGSGGGGGATGSVKQISKAAEQAASQLGQAGAAIGGGGGVNHSPMPISPIGPGGGIFDPITPREPVYELFAKGGKVRGAGIATQGVRPAKMR